MVIVVIGLYLGVGLVAAVVLSRRGRAQQPALLVLLWPFVLPPRLLALGTAHGPSAAAVERATRAAERALQRLPDAPEDGAGALRRFRTALLGRARRLEELEAASRDAPRSVQDKLTLLARAESERLDEGVTTLEEVAAQLTVLRFVGPSARALGDADQASVEDLLLRLQALLEVTEELDGAAAHAPGAEGQGPGEARPRVRRSAAR